jgi:hypothetical protein
MALPVTITGVAVTFGTGAGPYKSSAGDYYQIFKDSTTANKIRAFKSSGASDSAWSNVGTDPTVTGVTTAPGIGQIDAWQDGDTLHVAVACVSSGGSTLTDYTYHTFDMSSDTWTLTNEAIDTSVLTLSDTTAANARTISICKRTSSGEIVVALNSDYTVISMAEYSRVRVYRRTGVGAWTDAGVADGSGTTAAAAYTGAVVQPDPNSDAVYIGTLASVTNVGWLTTLTAANTLFRTSVSTWGSLTGGTNAAGGLQLACYDASGTTKLAMWANDTTGGGGVRHAYGNGNATGAVTLSSATLAAEGGNPFRFYSDDNSGTDTLYVIGTEVSTADIYLRSSTNHGQTWGSRSTIFTATVSFDTLLTNSHGSIYTRGGNYVIPYTVNDNGTVKYNEYILRSATTTKSVPPMFHRPLRVWQKRF